MNRQTLIIAAIAVVAMVVAFVVLGGVGGKAGRGGGKPAAHQESPATGTAAAPTKPASRPKPARQPGDDQVVLPLGAKPEDGGIAFGAALCDKLQSCDCQERSATACAEGWKWVTPDDYSTVKCFLDLQCSDACRIFEHPKDNACLVSIDQALSAKFKR